MAKQFIEIESASNDEAALMFSAICKKVIKQDEKEVKEMLGINPATSPTTKDLISLIQDSNVKCKITVFYDDETEYKQKPVQGKKEEKPVVETETPKTVGELNKEASGSDELPF